VASLPLPAAFAGVGTHNITATYTDNVDGNFLGSATTTAVVETINPAVTTTTLSGPTTAVFGQSVTLTAAVTVNSPGGGTPAGNVTFLVDGVPQGTVALSQGQASLPLSTLAVNTTGHTVTAVYTDTADSNYTASTSADLNLVVNQSATSVQLDAGKPTVFGQGLTLTATVGAVSPGAGVPTGTVTFTIDGVDQTPLTLVNGQAALPQPSLTATGHNVTVTYNPGTDPDFAGSTTTAVVTVAKADTSVN